MVFQGRPGGPANVPQQSIGDFVGSIVSGVTKRVGTFLGQTATGVGTGVASLGLPQQSVQMGVSPEVMGSQLAAQVGQQTLKAASWYDEHVWKPWSQIETSLSATVGTELNALQRGDFYNPINVWNRAWEVSDRSQQNPLTPAQAGMYVFQNIPGVKQVLGMVTPDSFMVNDVFSEAERQKYKTNPVLKWATGAGDFANNIFLDPTVLGGKVFKVAKLAVTNPIVDVEKGIFRTAEQRAAFEAGATQRDVALQEVNAAAQRVRDHDVAIADTVQKQLEIKQAMEAASADPMLGINSASYEKQITDLHDQWKLLDEQRKTIIQDSEKAQQRLADVRSTYMPPASAGAQTLVDAVHDLGYEPLEIMRNYTIREFGTNAATASSIIDAAAKLGDKTVTIDAIRALTGDVNAYQRLYDKATVVHEMLRRANGDLSHMQLHLDSIEKTGGDMAEYVAETQAIRDRISKEVDDLVLYDGFLREAIGEAGNPGARLRRQFARADAITDPLNSAAKFLPGPLGEVATKVASKLDELPALIESARIGKSASGVALELGKSIDAAQSSWRSRTYQFHNLARPVVVLQWAGEAAGREVPRGWVVLHGMGSEDGVNELASWLNSVKTWDAKPELKQKLLNDYITAGQSEHGKQSYIGDLRSRILLDAERQAFLDTAAAKNPDWLTPLGTTDELGNPQVVADELWNKYRSKRAKQIQAILQSRDTEKGRPGYWVDDEGKVVMMPVLDSQLAYSHPMLNMEVLHEAFNAASHEQMVNEISMIQSLALAGNDALKSSITGLYTVFDRIWRPATLLRLGYTQRNVAEGWLRSIAYFGHQIVAMAPFMQEGTKAWAQNRWARWQQKVEVVQQWKELDQQGINVPKAPAYLWGNVRTWGSHLEKSLAVQREQLNMMREGHGIVADAHLKSLESELRDAQRIAKELKTRSATGEDVAESLTAARADVRRLAKELRESTSTYVDAVITGQQEKVDRLAEMFRQFNDTLNTPGSKLNRVKGGTGEFAVGSHLVPDAFSDTSGQLLRDLVSSTTRSNVDMNLQSVLSLDAGERLGAKAKVFNPPNVRGLTADEIKGSPEYFTHLEKFVHELRNDTLAERMLEAYKTPNDFDSQVLESVSRGVKFLESAEGRSYVERLKSIGEYDPEVTPLTVATDRLEQLMSASGEKQDLLVRFAADKKRILASELRRDLFDNPHLRPVHGLETAKFGEIRRGEGILTALGNFYSRKVQRLFEILGSMPEDAMVRHPFARLVYMKHMREQIANWDAQGGVMTQDIMDRMVNDARALAVKETRKTLYTIMREKKIGSTRVAKAISPFVQAQLNSLSVWGKLLYQNPESLGYLQQIWRNLDKLGTPETDPQTGEKYLTFQFPAAVANVIDHVSPAMADALRTYNKWAFPKTGFNLIFPGLRGDDITTQITQVFGIGPAVQIPLGRWIVNNPSIDQELYDKLGIVLPVRSILSKLVPDDQLPREGTLRGSIVNALLPAWARNITAAASGDDSYRFGQTALLIAMTKMRSFLNDPANANTSLSEALPKMYAQAEREATMFMFIRAAANLGLPVVPKYQTELQPYINMLREYQDKSGNQQGFGKFIEEHPDLWFINASLSSNTSGMDSTKLSVFLAKKHSSLVDDVVNIDPKFVSMVTDTVKVGQFDAASNLWKRNQPKFVEKKTPQGALEDSQRAIGWLQYHRLNDAVDAILKSQGLTSVQQNPGLALGKATLVEKLKRMYPVWGAEKSTLESKAWEKNILAAYKVSFNPAVVKDTQNYNHMKFVRAYFTMRDQIVSELRNRTIAKLQARGVANPNFDQINAYPMTIDSAEARDLKAVRDAYVSQLRSNALFADFYDRWLDSDKMTWVEGTDK
jgi:hypothetical protein